MVDGERCLGEGEVEYLGQRGKERGLPRVTETGGKTASHL